MNNVPIRFFGFTAALFYGDTAVFDRWRWLKRHIVRGPVRTLDAGCGSGLLTFYAAKVGNEAVGISFNKRNNEVATARSKILGLENATFIIGDLRKLDKISGLGLFDQIICFETIEHIKDDRRLLKDLSNVLKSGGTLLLTTPYKRYRRFPGDKIFSTETGGHVRWGYTHKELRTLMNGAGFEVRVEDYITGYVSQKLIFLSRWLSLKSFLPDKLIWGLVLPLRIFQILDPIIMKVIRYPYMCVGIVAVKR